MVTIDREMIYQLFFQSGSDARVEVLVRLVRDLFMEVEALRECLIRLEAAEGTRPLRAYDPLDELSEGKSAYQKAYLKTAYLTHDSTGPVGEKVIDRFYWLWPSEPGQRGEAWRECLFLRRLGFSQDEIARYKEAAAKAMTNT